MAEGGGIGGIVGGLRVGLGDWGWVHQSELQWPEDAMSLLIKAGEMVSNGRGW